MKRLIASMLALLTLVPVALADQACKTHKVLKYDNEGNFLYSEITCMGYCPAPPSPPVESCTEEEAGSLTWCECPSLSEACIGVDTGGQQTDLRCVEQTCGESCVLNELEWSSPPTGNQFREIWCDCE